MYRIACPCGKEITVSGTKAGCLVTCFCGKQGRIPLLSLLKLNRQNNESTPLIDITSDASQDNVSDEDSMQPCLQYLHCCGTVGQDGTISRLALQNYAMSVQMQIEEVIHSIERTDVSALLVSVAIAPGKLQRVEVSWHPGDARIEYQERLIRQISQIDVPPIQEAPIAFAYYVHLREPSVGSDFPLKLFPNLKQSVSMHDLDARLRLAFGIALAHDESTDSAANSPKRRSWWRRMLPGQTRKPSSAPAIPSARDTYLADEDWVQQVEEFATSLSLGKLKRAASGAPDDLRYCIALAEKHRQYGALELAIEWYDRLLERSGDCAPLVARRAALHRQTGKTKEALMDYSRAIDQAPHEASFRVERAMIYCELAGWDAALRDLEEATRLNPFDSELYYLRGRLHTLQNNPDAAVDEFCEAVRLDPNFGHAHFCLGRLLASIDTNKVEIAIDHLNRALKLTKGNSEVRLHRSLIYLAQSKFALAMEDCLCVLGEEPENRFAHGIQGRILEREGQYEAAISACSRAIELGFEDVAVYLARAVSYSATDQNTLALSDCDVALALDPNNALVKQIQGCIKLEMGDLDAAMDAFHRARDLAPQWAAPREQLTLLHRMREDPQAAVEEQTNLIACYPKQATHYVNRAFAYVQLQNYMEAANDYDRAIQLEPENEQLYYIRGVFRLNCQETELALADFDHVLSIAGSDDNITAIRAGLLTQLKRYQEAIDAYDQLIAKYPEHPLAYSGRAFALASIGDSDQAKEDMNRVIEISPEHEEDVQRRVEAANLYRLTCAGDYDAALEAANQMIENYPDEALGYRLRAHVHWEREEYVESYDDFTRVMELSGPTPDCLSSRGQVQAELGEWDSALADLNQAVDLARQSGQNLVLAYALNGRSLTYAGMSCEQESSRDFEESVQLCPTNPWVYYHRGIQKFNRSELADAKVLLELALEFSDPPLSTRKKQRARMVLEKIASQSDT